MEVFGLNSLIRRMKVVVLANESLKEELINGVTAVNEAITWISDISQLRDYAKADVYIDLLFHKDHTPALQLLLPRLVFINSVEHTLSETDPAFIRFNGWPTFLKSNCVEASVLNHGGRRKAEEIFSLFQKKLEWLPDEPGFITPRIISMIINEAYISLKEGVSTKEEIDTAMKLGTNYPYGPFEWSEKIGVEKISDLLVRLGQKHHRYSLLPLLPK